MARKQSKPKPSNGAVPEVEPYSGALKAPDMDLPAPGTPEREAMRERALVVGAARSAAFQRATQGKGRPMTYGHGKPE